MNQATSLLLVVLVASASAGPPQDGISSGFFVPEPPQAQAPDIDLDVLGQILTLGFSGVQAGDSIAMDIGGLVSTIDIGQNGELDAVMGSGSAVQEASLPELPTGESLDFNMLVTPFSVVFDRAGDNAAAFPPEPTFPGNLDTSAIRDLTITNPGFASNLDIVSMVVPPHVTATNQVTDLTSTALPDLDLLLVDPEDSLAIIQDASDLDPASITAIDAATALTSATDIENALAAVSLEDLSLDGVLSGLQDAQTTLGLVDITDIAGILSDTGIAAKIIDDPGLDAVTFLDLRDPQNPAFGLINGGAGKIAGIGGADYLFDDNLVTALKDPESIKKTSFVQLVDKDGAIAAATQKFDASLGNYEATLNKLTEFSKAGGSVQVLEDLSGCSMVGPAQNNPVPGSSIQGCFTPDLLAQSLPGQAELMSALASAACGGITGNYNTIGQTTQQADCFVSMLPTGAGIPGGAVPGGVPGGVGGTPGGVGGGAPGFPGGAPSAPTSGIGSLPDLTPPTGFPTPSVPTAPTPSAPPDVTDPVYEVFDNFAVPGIAPVVPTDPTAGILGMATDGLTSGLTMVPLDMLEGLPVGHQVDLQIRLVGETGSLFSSSGIPGATVQVRHQDAMGLVKGQATQTTNANGYASFKVPALGSYNVDASHPDYLPTSGAGSTSPLSGPAGQEYTMRSANADTAVGAIESNLLWILLAAALVMGYVLYRRSKKGGKK